MSGRRWPAVSLFALASACAGSDVAIGPDACGAAVAPTTVSAGTDTGVVVVGSAANCLQLASGAGDYLVSVQLASSAIPDADYALDVSRPGARIVETLGGPPAPGASAVPLAFEGRRRAEERAWSVRAQGAQPRALSIRSLTRPVPTLGAIDTFKVIGALTTPYQFVSTTARLVYKGAHVLAYVDVAAPASFSDPEWAALGAHLEDPLYGVDTLAFGSPSDIDGNGHVIVLFTPRINALVSQIDCARSRSEERRVGKECA